MMRFQKQEKQRRRISFLKRSIPVIGLLGVFSVAQAATPAGKGDVVLPDNPDDHSGLAHSHSGKGYQQFDFNTVDLEALKKKGGKLYSSKEDVMKILTGGIKNPTGDKELWKEGLLFEGVEPMPWLESAAN